MVVLPVPDKDVVIVGSDAFDVTVTLPLAAPADAGANLTVNVVLCPAFNVKEELIPLRLNPVPLICTFDTEMVELPVLVMVPESDAFEPTVTVPNPRDVGLALNWPVVEPVPVPLNDTVNPGPGRNTLPLADPDTVGAKVAFRVALWPLESVSGRVGPLTVKPVPDV